MRILLIRHAEPDYTTDTLTSAGRREAAALAKHLASRGIDRLFSSPLGRARETADAIGKACNKEATVLPWTAELGTLIVDHNRWQHHMAWDLHAEHIRDGRPPYTHATWMQHEAFDGVDVEEEFTRIQGDSDAWLASLGYVREGGRYRIVNGHRDTIALACHGGFGLTWLAHLLDIPATMVWAGFFMPCSSVTTILFDERSPTWAVPRVMGLGELSHLHADGLPMSTKGVKANVD